MRPCKPVPVLAAILLACGTLAHSQAKEIDSNTYYRFPFSVGVEYQTVSPFTEYGGGFNIYDLSVNLRRPIPSLPVLQPSLRVGMTRFDSQDILNPLRWDHTDIHGDMGLAYSHRFAKNLELGAEAFAGYGVSLFPDLLPEYGTVSSSSFLFELGGRIHLNPLFNLSIDVHPNLKYLLSLSPLKDFNGLAFGLGFSASFRFGQDPDASAGLIRSIRFEEVSFPSAFAAMQSYYASNPIGSVVLTNSDKQHITDLQVSFFQPGYMDSTTPAASIEELKAGESRRVQLVASYNDRVFSTEGDTPLTGEIIAAYKAQGKPVEQRQSVSYFLHDKRAICWDDDRKVAAFITPSDSALRNYASFIRQACREATIPRYSEALQVGIQVFHALAEIGLLYQADAQLPFTTVQQNKEIVDSVSLPRETLANATGDCDDLTVLYCSMLETAGVRTAFITVPGHIFAAIGTGVPARDFRSIHPGRAMTINSEGELWVPVEITMVGKAAFIDAWRRGMEAWTALEQSPEKRAFFPTARAHEQYHPVGLKEADLGLQYGRKEEIQENVREEMDRIIETATQDDMDEAIRTDRKEAYNRLGVAYAQFGRYDQAEEAFQRALGLDDSYLSATINLASLLFLRKDYSLALERFNEAYAALEEQGQAGSEKAVKVLLNISRTYRQLGLPVEAKDAMSRAQGIDPARAAEIAYPGEPRSGDSRAAEDRAAGAEILFVEEE
jgi:tetratricopeptide (TPR) repeat protein